MNMYVISYSSAKAVEPDLEVCPLLKIPLIQAKRKKAKNLFVLHSQLEK